MIHSPHDHLFKSAMTDLRIARDFFDHYLPLSIQEAIDLNSLKLDPNSYIDEKLKSLSSDILYSVKLKSNQKKAYLYLLCEHQSSVDQLMPFRLWQYIIAIWSDHLKKSKEKTLPLVIPLVFYHGPEPYNGPRDIRELISAPNELIQKLFESFHLIDTHDLADETLREQKWIGIMTFVMKHIYERDFLVFMQPLIHMLEGLHNESNATEYGVTLLNYVLTTGKTASGRCFMQMIEQNLSESQSEDVTTIASRLIEIGRQEGEQKGMQQGESALLLRLLERKFGTLPKVYHQKIEQANSKQIFHWSTRLLETNDISALFDDCAVT